MWVTEVGVSTFGAEEVQEFGLKRTADLLIGRAPRIHWYSLYDLPRAWPATTRHREAAVHSPGKSNTPHSERTHLTLRTRMTHLVRKTMGYAHIPQKHAAVINQFYTNALNPYLNFHRPCYFAVETIDTKGKVKKTYPQDQIMTPYERLTSIPNYQSALRPDVTAEILQQRSVAMSDNEAAQHVQESRSRLFQKFNRRSKVAA